MFGIAHVIQKLEGRTVLAQRGLGSALDIFDILEQLLKNDIIRRCKEGFVGSVFDDRRLLSAHRCLKLAEIRVETSVRKKLWKGGMANS